MLMLMRIVLCMMCGAGKGGKNRRRGKNDNEDEKRELVFKEDGQGKWIAFNVQSSRLFLSCLFRSIQWICRSVLLLLWACLFSPS